MYNYQLKYACMKLFFLLFGHVQLHTWQERLDMLQYGVVYSYPSSNERVYTVFLLKIRPF